MSASRPEGLTRHWARPSRLCPMEGAVTVPILRVRYSPGLKGREATRHASDMGFASESSVREVSCFLPFLQKLHALCHCGASRKMRSLRGLLDKIGTQRNSCKAHTLNVLLMFDFRDSRSGRKIRGAVAIPY